MASGQQGRARQQARVQERQANRAQVDRRAMRNERQAQVQQRAKVRNERQAQVQQRANMRTQRQAQVQQRAMRNNQALARAEQQRLGRNQNPVIAARDRNVVAGGQLNGFAGPRLAEGGRGFGVGGCPPGLAKKPIACMPPGQAQSFVGARVADVARVSAFDPLPDRLRYIYPDTSDYYYRYGDGYLYRVNRTDQVIRALLPLFGLGYGIGQPFPTAYSNYYLPSAYQPFYPATPYYDYRYADGYIYEVDPYTGLIADVDPMLGYGYGYGQMMPLAYSAYNVPYQYRPYYYDTSDYYYRYAPGAIYQVDPTTSLITAVAALLTNGLTVGQPLPVGYGAYNVPYAYRTSYYDTPDAWYRYSNGYIYRVNPMSGIVTERVVTIV